VVALTRKWDTVIVTGSVKYDSSNQQNHALATETVPAGRRPYGNNPTAINYGVVAAVNAKLVQFRTPQW
jgi:hypothetical protein